MSSSKQIKKLIQASFRGDVSCIEELLSKKVDVNCTNDHKQFPILVASQNGHKEAVQLLVQRGANVNMISCNGVTALSLASECGHHETVEILVENGAHIDHKVSDGRTPLMLASENGHEETVQVLLSRKADVNLSTELKQTALTYALRNNSSIVAKRLIPHVRDIDSRDSTGITPLMIAALCGLPDIVELLLTRGARVNLRTPKGSTALIVASQTGSVETVKILLKQGAYINLQNDNGVSALMIASRNGHKDVVEVLLSHGAEVKLSDTCGKSALILAIAYSHVEIVKLLVCEKDAQLQENKPGACVSETKTISHQEVVQKQDNRSQLSLVNRMDNQGQSALIIASSCRDRVTVEILLRHGANPNIVSKQDQTALSVAASLGDLVIVKSLVQHGASVSQPLGKNSPLSIAVTKQYVNIVQVLLESDSSVRHEDLIQACACGCFEIVKLLIPHCTSLDPDWPVKNKFYFDAGLIPSDAPASPLWWAVKNNHTDIALLLLENDASVNDVVMSGKEIPALVIATVQENVKIVEALLHKGAYVDVTTGSITKRQTCTPLMLAIVAGHEELVRLFTKYGADICLDHRSGISAQFTCMDLAKAVGNLKIISILKEEGSRQKATLADVGDAPNPAFWRHMHKFVKPESYPALSLLVKQGYIAISQCLNLQYDNQSHTPHQKLKDLFPNTEEEEVESDEDSISSESQLPAPIPPTVNTAYRILLPLASNWKGIGTLLDIEYNKLKIIEADKKTSVTDALLEMVDEWIKMVDPKPTWDKLVDAVKPFHPSIAQKIYETHCTL